MPGLETKQSAWPRWCAQPLARLTRAPAAQCCARACGRRAPRTSPWTRSACRWRTSLALRTRVSNASCAPGSRRARQPHPLTAPFARVLRCTTLTTSGGRSRCRCGPRERVSECRRAVASSLSLQASRFARVCLEEAFKYALKRRTFGKPLMEHPVIRWKIAESECRASAGGWMRGRAAISVALSASGAPGGVHARAAGDDHLPDVHQCVRRACVPWLRAPESTQLAPQ